jgi:flagellar biosynthesis/type III secretory pathway protein FliH
MKNGRKEGRKEGNEEGNEEGREKGREGGRDFNLPSQETNIIITQQLWPMVFRQSLPRPLSIS